MSKLQTILLTLAISFTVFALVLISRPQAIPFSGVNYGSEMQSTTTRNFAGTALTTRVLKAEPGALGSITITGANTGIIRIYDQDTLGAHAAYPTTTLAEIPASTAAGTYVFDVIATRGIVYEVVSGLAPTSTISYR